MRQFDPWPVFFRREWNRNWPFLVGFAVTGYIITKFSLGLTEEDVKNSPFAQKHKRVFIGCFWWVYWLWIPSYINYLSATNWRKINTYESPISRTSTYTAAQCLMIKVISKRSIGADSVLSIYGQQLSSHFYPRS